MSPATVALGLACTKLGDIYFFAFVIICPFVLIKLIYEKFMFNENLKSWRMLSKFLCLFLLQIAVILIAINFGEGVI